MKCKFCKEEIPDEVKFCPMCGSGVEQEESLSGTRIPGSQSMVRYIWFFPFCLYCCAACRLE